MSPVLRTCPLLLSTFVFCQSLLAQSDPAKYKERAAAVRQEVWGWKVAAFNNRSIPAQYANESSVILARRAVIEADSKKKVDWVWGAVHRNFFYNSTVRELVKINDKASLEEYSKLSYSQFKKLNEWLSSTATTFVGARIIKSDGSVKEVNVDEAVVMKSEKNDQQRKLAISDLQVGDILDFYVHVEEFSESSKVPERMIFEFGDDHPILDYSIHCDIGSKYAVEYRSMNHAPEAKFSTNDDKDMIIDIDVPNIAAVPTGLWMSPLRQIPAFRINILEGGKEASGRAKGEVVKDVPLKDVLRNCVMFLDADLNAKLQSGVAKILSENNYRKLSKDSLAYLIYYAYRFTTYYNQVQSDLEVGEDRNAMELDSRKYMGYLAEILNKYDFTWNLLAVPSRFGPDINNIMAPGDFSWMIKVNLDKPLYFSNMNMFTCPDHIPSGLEGQSSTLMGWNSKHKPDNKRGDIVGLSPLSNAADNVHREDMKLSIEGADMQLLHVQRHTTLTGKMKEREQLRLLNFEDCYESERAALGVEKSIMDELKKARRSKNVSEDYATALQKARNSLKDRFKAEISSEFEEDPKDLIAWKVDNPGLRYSAPDLVYSTEFTVDRLIQRAGNNYLLNIGKTFSAPLKLTPSQRSRTVDAYMPYARTLDCTVSFVIPNGYSVQGVDKLNKTLENDCGSVASTAQVQGNQLVVHFKRIYKHNTEAVGKWSQLLALLDASTDFAGQKVLLKKG